MSNVLGGRVRVKLKNILLIPSFSKNLVLNHQVLYGHGRKQSAVFKNRGATVYDKATRKVLIQASDTGVSIPVVELKVKANEVKTEAYAYMTVAEVPSLQQLHCHFNHLNECKLRAIACQLNIPVWQGAKLSTCASCVKKRLRRLPVRKGPAPRAERPMQTLCVNIVGPIQEETREGHKYALTIVDSFLCHSWVYPLCSKGAAVTSFKHFFSHLPADLEPMERLITDQGGEFLGGEICSLLATKGVVHTTTPAYTPELNGVVERFNQTLLGATWALLNVSGLEKEWWGEAMHMANIIYNVTPHKANNGKSPLKVFLGIYHSPLSMTIEAPL